MLRRLLPAFLALAAVLAAVLAACAAPATPGLTDPHEIVTRGLEATANLDSFHLELALDGSVADPSSGSTFPLSGTSIEADVDIANQAVAASFGVMGFSGDLRVVDGAAYVKMSLTGPQWIKSEIDSSVAAVPMSVVGDVPALLDEVGAFLGRDGVDARLLAEGSCTDRPCYHVQLTLAPALLDEAARDAGETSTLPSSVLPDGLAVDLFFDRELGYLSRLALDLGASKLGDVSAVLNLSKVNEGVTVEAPPADEVTTDTGGFSFP